MSHVETASYRGGTWQTVGFVLMWIAIVAQLLWLTSLASIGLRLFGFLPFFAL